MQTVIVYKSDDGKKDEFKIQTEQYELGTYVCIYLDGNLVSQYGVRKKEIAFHKAVRRKAEKLGGKIIKNKSSIIETKGITKK